MPDVFHQFGNDLVASANGDLLTADSVNLKPATRSAPAVDQSGRLHLAANLWRRASAKIGDPFDVATIESIVQSQMYLEDSVVRDPPPDVEVASFPNGMFVDITYTEADCELDAVLSFPVTPTDANG